MLLVSDIGNFVLLRVRFVGLENGGRTIEVQSTMGQATDQHVAIKPVSQEAFPVVGG
jgi:hypothetical protein